MDINSIPEMFQSKVRLAIIAALITGDKTFSQIKEIVQATDGNLSVQFTKLEEKNYLSVSKSFVGKKPQTTYSLTEFGRMEFESYVKLLESIINGSYT